MDHRHIPQTPQRDKPTGYYSAMRPDGQRVLLPVGHYYDREGRLRTGAPA